MSTAMERNERYTMNKCSTCKSFPNILFPTKPSQLFQLRRSQSLPSSLKFAQRQSQYYKTTSRTNSMHDEKKNSDPTIGDLLGDDELFHYRYHNQYSSSRSKRQRYPHYHQSHSRSSSIHVQYGRRKHRRSTYSNTTEESGDLSPSKLIQSIPNTHQVYPYSTTYNYTPVPTYCYYCCTNMTSCFISDSYGGFYPQETYYQT